MHSSIARAAVLVIGLVASVRAAETRLNYQGENLVKDAKYYLDRLDGAAADLKKQTDTMKVGDASVQIQKVEELLAIRQQMEQYFTNVDDRIKILPADNAKVKAQADRVKPLRASFAASYQKLDEVKASLAGVVALGTGPAYAADLKRLQELAGEFGRASQQIAQPDRSTDIAGQHDAAVAERKRFGDKYAALTQQSTVEAKQFAGSLEQFDKQLGEYDKAAADFVAGAPQAVGGQIDEVIKLAAEGVAGRKHLYFAANGGITQRLVQITASTNLLAAIAPGAPETKHMQARLAAARDKVKSAAAGLMTDIVAANACPADQYGGPDHSALLAMLKTKWATSGVNGDVLKTGINSTQWTRSTRWSWSNDTWYKIDTSFTQGFVLVKADDKLATVYTINLVKDHMAGDAMSANFFDDLKAEPDVTRKVLLDRVK